MQENRYYYFTFFLHSYIIINIKLEIDNIIDETINLSIILKLRELKIITEPQFYKLREKIKAFY